MVNVECWYVQKGERVIQTVQLSRVPCKYEKLMFEGHAWALEVKEVTHYPHTDSSNIAATCFLTY